MEYDDEFRSAALALVGDDQELRELIRRCIDEDDRGACLELDRRGIEPPALDVVDDRQDAMLDLGLVA